MFGNVFNSDAFGAIAITKALNLMEPVSTEMDRWFEWEPDYSTLPDVAVDVERGRLYVLASVADDAPLPIAKKGQRGVYKIEIPRFGERETLLNRSLLGVRETGSREVKQIEAERDKRLRLIRNRVQHTKGWLQAKALDGKVYDGDGVLLADFHTKQDRGQIVIEIDLTTGPDVNDEFVLVKEICERVLSESNFGVTGYKLVCGRRAHQFLRTNDSVKEAMTDPLNNKFLRSDNRDGFLMADNVNVVNMTRTHAGVGFIDEGIDPQYGTAYLVPEAMGFANIVYGPSGVDDFLGNPLEFYGGSEPRKQKDGVELWGDSFMIPYFAIARGVIKLVIKGTPRVNDQLAAILAEEVLADQAIDAGDDVPA